MGEGGNGWMGRREVMVAYGSVVSVEVIVTRLSLYFEGTNDMIF